MKLFKILMTVLHLSSIATQCAGKTVQVVGNGVECGAYGLKKAAQATEMGANYFAKMGGIVKTNADKFNSFTKAKLEEINLSEVKDFKFRSSNVEEDWVLIDRIS